MSLQTALRLLRTELPDPMIKLFHQDFPLTTFHLFNELPIELRFVIWNMARTRTIEAHFDRHGYLRSWTPAPVTFRVNQESRNETLKYYAHLYRALRHSQSDMEFEESFPPQHPALHQHFFDPGVDTVLLRSADGVVVLINDWYNSFPNSDIDSVRVKSMKEDGSIIRHLVITSSHSCYCSVEETMRRFAIFESTLATEEKILLTYATLFKPLAGLTGLLTLTMIPPMWSFHQGSRGLWYATFLERSNKRAKDGWVQRGFALCYERLRKDYSLYNSTPMLSIVYPEGHRRAGQEIK